MRKTLCTLLYRLGLRRQAYKVSTSVYGYLRGKEVQAAVAAGLAAIGGMAKAMTEEAAPAAAKHEGLRAKVLLADELHAPADRAECGGCSTEVVFIGKLPVCEHHEEVTE